ncbi:MAG: hypothetical protein EU533_09130 [Promethearchaeota archaeon]|nr:MAG: hypothetical protein EU533_09130 [Candidatus Lokiarchaeota archaeon]
MEDSDLNKKLNAENKRDKDADILSRGNLQYNQPDGLNMLSSKSLDYSIKNLSSPNFLGSLHFNKEMTTYHMQSVENLMQGDLDLRINKSLKNTLMNPITKSLILLMIAFNIIWLVYFYIL